MTERTREILDKTNSQLAWITPRDKKEQLIKDIAILTNTVTSLFKESKSALAVITIQHAYGIELKGIVNRYEEVNNA